MQMNRQNPSAFECEKYQPLEIVADHSRTLKIVQQRLEDLNEVTSNGTIATIIYMIIHSVRPKIPILAFSYEAYLEYSTLFETSRCGIPILRG